MDETPKKLLAILDRAEAELRELIADSARRGDYGLLDQGRDAAGKIRTIISSLNGHVAAEVPRTVLPRAKRRSQRKDSKAISPSGAYPRFFIRRNVLFKVGWSKREKKEYLHKINKDAFDTVTVAMECLLRAGRSPFTAEEIVEHTNKIEKPVPIYQVYVALSLLRHCGLLQKEGREGYSSDTQLIQNAVNEWDKIASNAA